MGKYGNFLRTEAYRRTFFSYLVIALLFTALILGFVYRDIYKTAREDFEAAAAAASEDLDRKTGELVKAIDQFSARIYSNTGASEDFFRFFGASAEEYISRRMEVPQSPETYILSEFKELVIRSNFSIRHVICYAHENVVDLEFNTLGDVRHRVITPEKAEQICRSGSVYQLDVHRDSVYLGKVVMVADITGYVDDILLSDPNSGICLVLPDRIIPMGGLQLTIPQARRLLAGNTVPERFSDGELSLYCAVHHSQVLPYSLVYYTSTHAVLGHLFFNFFLLALCFLLAFGAISMVLVRRFSKDTEYLNMILSSMEQAEKENFAPLSIPGAIPEYDEIIRGLNNLYSHLESHIEQEYKLTISQQKAEMDLLSAQLSPHFLYNTLERIRMRAVLEGTRDVAEATAGLGRLYRNIVKTQPVIPLSKEVEITEQYLDLMTFLYGDQFMYYFDVDPELLQMQTPKIWMQPIVENFFKHNFQQDDQIKIIVVELKAIAGGFEGRFFDNIGSLSQEELSRMNERLQAGNSEGTGMGLINVLHRLRLYYGPELMFTMENNDPTGICIHIEFQKEG